ncbi:MAG: serine protease, partial [Clostridiales bacterium]|nr:serine protease [Clostridiales bacterium]
FDIFGINKSIIEFDSDEDPDNNDNQPIETETSETEATEETEIESETEKYVQPTIINNTIAADLDDLSNIYYEVKRLADDASKAMVLVTSIKSNKDWFENEIEVPDNTNGLIVANNGVDLLVLVNYDQIQGANTIQVTFTNDIKAEATLQAFDSELNLAIIAIALDDLSEEIREISVADLGESTYLPVGTPIIAIGSPNGYMNSMEIGMINTRGSNINLTDYQIDLFHSDITHVEDGEGYIINLKGKIVGIITNHLSDDRSENINTFIGISNIKPIIEALVNNDRRAYLGITAIDITDEALEELGLENGIAVTGVIANSPAYHSGIQIGDILTSVNGEDIISVLNFQSRLLQSKPEDMFDITIHREYQNSDDTIKLEIMLETRKF